MTTYSVHAHEIHLRWSSMTEAEGRIDALRRLLEERELDRADRFRVEKARRRFINARAALRLVLGEFVASRPEEIVFCYGKRGKPRLPGSDLYFNASDSGDIVVIGLAGEELGVDLEMRRPLGRPEQLARRVCAATELETWRNLPEALQNPVLLRLWTCKEAILKAVGTGLSGGLTNAVVDLQPDGSTPRGAFFDDELTLLPIQIPADVVGTVAIRGAGWSMVHSRMQL